METNTSSYALQSVSGFAKMNVLILGNSGAGKSTLIKAIAGVEVQTGVGEAVTQKISIYESSTWPFRLIDTKGFEYDRLAQMKTIHQIKKFSKQQIQNNPDEKDENKGIDAVWYCIEGTSRKTFSYNTGLMEKAIKNWKNIPVFAVITKSYGKSDIEENKNAVMQVFAKAGNINLQRIIPVVAEPFEVNDGIIVEPFGIAELCNATLACSSEAKKINSANRYRMLFEQKRFTAQTLVSASTAAAVVVGAVSVPFADSLILVPLETALAKGILKIYDVEITGDLVTSIVGSTVITSVAKTVLSSLKTIPNLGASIINGVVAGCFVAALGEAVILLAENIYSGKIKQDDLNAVSDFITEKLVNSRITGSIVKFFKDNSDKLQGKSASDIFKIFMESMKGLGKN